MLRKKQKQVRLEKKECTIKKIMSENILLRIQLVLIIILIICLFVLLCTLIGQGENATNWYNYRL